MKKYLKYIIMIALLVPLDQGIKLAISRFYTFDSDPSEFVGGFHIHPMINYDTYVALSGKAAQTGQGIGFWIGVYALQLCCVMLLVLAFYYMTCAVSAIVKRKKMPVLFSVGASLMVAITMNRILDLVLRKGALDYLCYSKLEHMEANGVVRHMSHHLTFDLTDLYALITVVLVAIYALRQFFTFIWLNMHKEQEKEFTQELKRRVKAFFKKPIGLMGEKADAS